jgi:hypothetical protein
MCWHHNHYNKRTMTEQLMCSASSTYMYIRGTVVSSGLHIYQKSHIFNTLFCYMLIHISAMISSFDFYCECCPYHSCTWCRSCCCWQSWTKLQSSKISKRQAPLPEAEKWQRWFHSDVSWHQAQSMTWKETNTPATMSITYNKPLWSWSHVPRSEYMISFLLVFFCCSIRHRLATVFWLHWLR